MANSTTNLDTISSSQASKEITANALFDAASAATTYGRRASTTTGLTWGYYGGNVTIAAGTMSQIANGTVSLTASQTNYLVAAKSSGAVSVSTTTTNWNDTDAYWRLYSIVAGASSVTSYTDSRQFALFSGAVSFGAMSYQGTWNASTNTPTLASGAGTKGYYYVVSVDGTTTLDGISSWSVGDAAAFNGTTWNKIEGGLSAQELGNLIAGATEKTTPADADMVGLMDSAAGNIIKKLSWANIKTTLGTTFAALAGSVSQAFSASTIELGHATDTTLSRVSAGVVAIEGSNIVTAAALNGGTLPASVTTLAIGTALADNDSDASGATTAFVQSQIANNNNPTAIAQSINMTAAASGSNGIAVNDNANINLDTGNFTLHWEGSLPNRPPSAAVVLMQKHDGTNGWKFQVETTGILSVVINATTYSSTVANNFVDGTVHKRSAVVTRENASLAGSIIFYADGIQLGASVAITAGAPTTVDNAVGLYTLGTSAIRYAGTCKSTILFNRALAASEVVDLCRKSVAFEDRGGSMVLTATSRNKVVAPQLASQTHIRSLTVLGGEIYGGTAYTGNLFGAGLGATLALEPEGIQPEPGQWLDSSGNKLHAMQPAAGSSLTRKQDRFEVRWANTWAGTHEAQFIGGVNQAVLPSANIRIESITMRCSATGVNVILGDGSATSRWVASVALATYLDCTVANRNHDGTNRKLVIDPDAIYTGTITTTIVGRILD